jgi:hypothetical protein
VAETLSILVLSDIHYAGAAEKLRGWREDEIIRNPALRWAVRSYRRYIWRRDPFAHNGLLDRFLGEAPPADLVFANGDYSCDTAFVGLSDDASYQSASECLAKLRDKFGTRLHLTIGDHELGKTSLFGGCGGMRLTSWHRAQDGLGLLPFWRINASDYVLMGVTSSLLALPVYGPETLTEELTEWEQLREEHLRKIRQAFDELTTDQRVILFCHDPSALPFLWREERIRAKLHQVRTTIIGHLHSDLYLWQSRLLAGMPAIHCLGNSVRRMSVALHEARHWRPFQVQLCPALAGIELLKDGGYLSLELDSSSKHSLRICFHPLSWNQNRSPNEDSGQKATAGN